MLVAYARRAALAPWNVTFGQYGKYEAPEHQLVATALTNVAMIKETTSQGNPWAMFNRRCLRRAVFLLYILVVLEFGTRGFWTFRYGVPYFAMPEIWSYRFYPELHDSDVLETAVTKDDEFFDVLILGGSVISVDFSDIDERLKRKLVAITGRPVRVFNCAKSALNSRDSLLKYRSLAEKAFDLVVVYHALNDARMNNCSRSRFRENYNHCSWYYRIHALDYHPELYWSVLPYTLEYTIASILDSKSIGYFLSRHRPTNWNWIQEGQDLKTPNSFRRHMTEIVALAQQRKADVLLLGYAWHIPNDYTLERFKAKQLDYFNHSMPVELVGSPDAVRATCRSHNQIIREIAAVNAHVLYVDQQGLLPKQAKYFDDVCHLTSAGSERFVDNLQQPLADWYGMHGSSLAAAQSPRLPATASRLRKYRVESNVVPASFLEQR